MVNTQSSLDNLRKGRGQKKKLGHKSYSIKLSPTAKKKVEDIAESFNCVHGKSGSISALLKKVASEELMVVVTPPDWEHRPESTVSDEIEILPNPSEVIDDSYPTIETSKLL